MLELNKVYNMNCNKGINQLSDNSVDCIISDPPYNLNKEGIINDDSLWGYELDYYRVLKNDSWLCLYCSIGFVDKVIKFQYNLSDSEIKEIQQHVNEEYEKILQFNGKKVF
jgi:DNA modification methylase